MLLTVKTTKKTKNLHFAKLGTGHYLSRWGGGGGGAGANKGWWVTIFYAEV